MTGTIKTIKGGGTVSIGFPSNKEKDWVALLKVKTSKRVASAKKEAQVITLDALSDFQIDATTKDAIFYRDELNGVLAIDASNLNNRNKYAHASTVFKGETGLYKASFVTMAENDGESIYLMKINGSVLDTITNPETTEAFEAIHHDLDKVYLYKNDIIQISSKAVTNGKIPENNETAWSRERWNALTLIPDNLSIKEQLKDSLPFEEKEDFLEIKAEDFHYSSDNGTERNWYLRSDTPDVTLYDDNVTNHSDTASGNSYIEALSDTRITHDDPLIHGENFFPIAGVGGIVSYKVKINTPGKYYVWAQAFSSGTEDNGAHVGLDERWPESGARIQWCDGKNKWTWSSAQRMPDNHCGEPNTIFLTIYEPGEYIISFSMREDGFELDRWIMTNNSNFIPK